MYVLYALFVRCEQVVLDDPLPPRCVPAPEVTFSLFLPSLKCRARPVSTFFAFATFVMTSANRMRGFARTLGVARALGVAGARANIANTRVGCDVTFLGW